MAVLMGIIRHVLTFSGGMLAFTGDERKEFLAGATTLIGLAWSLLEKRRKKV